MSELNAIIRRLVCVEDWRISRENPHTFSVRNGTRKRDITRAEDYIGYGVIRPDPNTLLYINIQLCLCTLWTPAARQWWHQPQHNCSACSGQETLGCCNANLRKLLNWTFPASQEWLRIVNASDCIYYREIPDHSIELANRCPQPVLWSLAHPHVQAL